MDPSILTQRFTGQTRASIKPRALHIVVMGTAPSVDVDLA